MTRRSLKSTTTGKVIDVEWSSVDGRRESAFRVKCGSWQGIAELEVLGPLEGCLRIDGCILPFRWMRSQDTVQVWLGGQVHSFEMVSRIASRAGKAHALAVSTRLTAPMPGTILKVQAPEGASFKAHDPLIIMESMKMEMTLSVPHSGIVKEVLCRPGQLVAMGAELLTFEADSDEPQSS